LAAAGTPEAIFAHLSPDQRSKLEGLSVEVSLKKGAQLFAPGEPTKGFYLVRQGAIRVYGISPQGKEITQEIVGPPSALALGSPFSEAYHYFAEALEDSRLLLIKKKDFFNLIATDPGFAADWIRMLSLLVVYLRGRLSDLTLKGPKARIAGYLLLLAERQNSRSITIPVSRKELAILLGMTHETFYRTTKELVTQGLVQFSGRTVDILDQELLREMSE
jgi:CRP-like cAMP-binding protein